MKKKVLFIVFACLFSFSLTSCDFVFPSFSVSETSSNSIVESTSDSSVSNDSSSLESVDANVTVSSYPEAINISWNDTDYSDTQVYYKTNSSSNYTVIDSELIRGTSSVAQASIVGLTAGTYDVKVVASNNQEYVKSNIVVSEADRSGYAFFNQTTGIGAYNLDGTLKSDAIVIYVTDATKNTVSYGGYTGLVNILRHNFSQPICIRIVGTIATNQYSARTFSPVLSSASYDSSLFTNPFETKYTNLNGLTNSIKSPETSGTTTYNSKKYYDTDSYFNMLDVKQVNDVTVEGIGADATILQWGFTWSKCNSIEVKNLTFTDYPEDACSFQGVDSTDNNYSRFWVHNNQFNVGKNNWDLTAEQDKHYGDGAMDLKYCHGITSSYNVFNGCKKTGLVGGGDDNLQYDITFHHNYYNQVSSRLPLGRQANMHIYNNYYYKCGTAQDIRANAYVFSEANYFENCKVAQKITVSSDYQTTRIKSYNDVYYSTSSSTPNTHTGVTTASSRTQTISNANFYVKGSTFDTDPNYFYYDSTNHLSDVMLLTTAATAKTDCLNLAGVFN